MDEEQAPQTEQPIEEEQPQEAGETVTFHGHGFIVGVPGTFAGEQVTLSADGTQVLARTPLQPVEALPTKYVLPPEESTPPQVPQESAQDTPVPVAQPEVAEVPPMERRRPGRVRTTAEAPEQPPEGPAA